MYMEHLMWEHQDWLGVFFLLRQKIHQQLPARPHNQPMLEPMRQLFSLPRQLQQPWQQQQLLLLPVL
jgi:hypothetical protein